MWMKKICCTACSILALAGVIKADENVKKIIFVGDSISVGVGATSKEKRYTTLAVKMLNDARKKYNPKGRFQTAEEIAKLEEDLYDWLDSEGYEYEVMDYPDNQRLDKIIERLKEVAGIEESELNG